MSRPIEADALKKYMRDYKWEFALDSDFSKAMEMVDVQPTIEAVPVVHGKWIMRGGKKYCTVCGKKALEEKDRDDWYGCVESNFCPNCGADMRKGGAT